MCGISGFNWKDEKKVGAMVACLAHRGPDAAGTFAAEGISLGHNRLSVIDLSAEANQPMWDSLGELVVVFNGEIYNYQELRKELEAHYAFKTKSDTEVILAGYRAWGVGVVEHLSGMFAFAIWDTRDRSLFCARDHAGMKPFYYFWDGKKFIFASELPAIFAHGVSRTLNRESFNRYLRVLYTPEPMTMVEDVYKLPPSCTLMLKGNTLTVDRYGTTVPEPSRLSYDEAARELKIKVVEAVGRHLVADVPVGMYLSGGIDSSVVLSAMTSLGQRVKTFSIGFALEEGEESEKFNSDFELAKRTSAHFGAEHHPVVISADDALDSLTETSAHNSDPVSHPTAAVMLRLARFAREQVTVSLTGNGGDELFGGYERYRQALVARYWRALPASLRSLAGTTRLARLEGDDTELFAQFMFIKDKTLSTAVAPDVLMPGEEVEEYFRSRYFAGSGDTVARLMEADRMSWLPDYFFLLADKMSMASALEERMPLVDKDLVAFARSLPVGYKVGWSGTKKILKDAFRKDLPPYLFDQPKRGWFAPAAKWLRRPAFARIAREVLSSGYYPGTAGLFNWLEVERMLERHISKEEYNLTLLWAILTFQLWARQHRIEA